LGEQEKKSSKKVSWIPDPLSWGKKESLRIFIFCFITAFIFWGLNSLNKNYEANINMPLEVVYNDSFLIPLDPPPDRIPLRVSGYGWDLIRWTFGWRIEPLRLEPEGLPETQILALSFFTEKIDGKLQDLKVVNYVSTELPLNFDLLERKIVPITFDSTTIPFSEDRYLKKGLKIVPDSLVFIGPKSLLENLKEQYKLELPVEGIKKDYNSSISVQFPHSELVSVEPENINVSFPVGEWVSVEREVELELRSRRPATTAGFSPRTSTVKVVFKLPEGGTDGPKFDSVLAFVNLARLAKGDSILKVELENIPSGSALTLVFPDSVQLEKRDGQP
jgi:hypothetical protein